MDSSTLTLDLSVSNRWDFCIVFIITIFFIEIPVFNANSVDPDQMSQNPASDLGLHCLPWPLSSDARHTWVNP